MSYSPKWDLRFLRLAEHVSAWSRDPSTQCGAVLALGNQLVSVGFNGFPRGCDDDPALYADRDRKLARVVHAEENAILFARRDLAGHTLYNWPFVCCSHCAAVVVQAGIARVVAPPIPSDKKERWEKSVGESLRLFAEADVQVDIYDVDRGEVVESSVNTLTGHCAPVPGGYFRPICRG